MEALSYPRESSNPNLNQTPERKMFSLFLYIATNPQKGLIMATEPPNDCHYGTIRNLKKQLAGAREVTEEPPKST